jgi:hypothetical protein
LRKGLLSHLQGAVPIRRSGEQKQPPCPFVKFKIAEIEMAPREHRDAIDRAEDQAIRTSQ